MVSRNHLPGARLVLLGSLPQYGSTLTGQAVSYPVP
jgi:hypothetical protein